MSRFLLSLFVLCAAAGCVRSIAAPRPPAADDALDAYLRSVYPATEPGAAVLVVREGRTLVRSAYGVADLVQRRPLTADDQFHIASITKNMTAAAVLRLVAAGQLSLDDPVTAHLPDAPATWNGVRVRHLLTHTSGLIEFTTLLPDESTYVHHDELYARVRDRPPVSLPGAALAYSNTGYLLLGRLIERRTGRPWGDHMQRSLYAPLGMRRTVYAGAPGQPLVAGHQKVGGRLQAARVPTAIPYAAGATLSTVDDLATWFSALDDGRVLPDPWRSLSQTRVVLNDGATASAGMGWLLSTLGPHDVQWHGGDITGYASMVLRIPAQRLLVIVLSNNASARERPMFVAFRLAELALGEDWSRAATVAPERLASLVGDYRAGGGETFLVTMVDGRLHLRTPEQQEPSPLLPLSDREFVGPQNARVSFSSSALRLRPFLGADVTARRLDPPGL